MKILIIKCKAVGHQFDNLTPGSMHEVIEEKYSEYNGRRLKKGNYLTGYWVQGVGAKVVVLVEECTIIE